MDNLDWSLIRSVLAVADTGSLSAAARSTGQSQPTLGRQIKLAEDALGAAIFTRHARGLRLSTFGQSLMPAMRAMEDSARALSLTAAGQDHGGAGTVRVTASEIVSAYLLPPIIAGLRAQHPEITIELVPTDTTENLLFHEADIAIRMYRPTQLEMITRHLGDLPIGIYAADSYVARRGTPSGPHDMADHDWLGYDRDDRIILGMRAMGFDITRDFFSFRCDNQVTYWQHLLAGAGLGIGQQAVARQYTNLTQVLPDLDLPKLPVWLTAHETLRHVPRVARVWDTLADGLKPRLS